MANALASLGVERPSHIQAAALRALPRGGGGAQPARAAAPPAAVSHPPPVLIADHAGSGKTLAYLVPLVQAIADAEAGGGRPSAGPRPPAALCLVPTSELAAQVLATARALSRGGMPFRSVGLTGGRPWRTQRDALREGCDLVVATPGRAAAALADGALDVGGLVSLVLDEADVLLAGARSGGAAALADPRHASGEEEVDGDGEGERGVPGPARPPAAFVEQVRPILQAAGRRPGARPRLVLVTATVPEPVYDAWALNFPGLTPVLGPGLHRPAPGVTQRLVDCSGDDRAGGAAAAADPDAAFERKATALIRLLQEDAAEAAAAAQAGRGSGPRGAPPSSSSTPGHAVVFVHTVEAARRVENLLARRMGGTVTPLAYHAAITPQARTAALAALAAPPAPPSATGAPPPRLILISTDRASRGIDTAHASHVILFSWPRDPSEYIRRAGRVCRGAGGGGSVSLFAVGGEVPLARDIIERGSSGLPIHRVPRADV
jgi:ATP-dependent RNA helicase DDX18/HAS1